MASNDTTPSMATGAPLATLTPTDQSGVAAIGAALALSIAACATLIRFFIRREFRNQFQWDDALSFGSFAVFVAQSAIIFLSISKGFGRTGEETSEDDTQSWQKLAYTSEILYPVILWLTRCSVAYLYIRLTPDRKHILASYGLLALSTVFMVVSVFIIAIRCDLAKPWIFVEEACPSLLNRWISITAFNVVSEILLVAGALYLLRGLQVPSMKKMIVLFAFAQRLVIIAPSILRLRYLQVEYASSDPALDGVLASLMMQIELAYAIVATTTPCLRPFMAALSTHYGGPVEVRSQMMRSKLSHSGNSSGRKGSRGNDMIMPGSQPQISLRSMLKNGSQTDRSNSGTLHSIPRTRWDTTGYNVNVASDELARKKSMDSNESRQMIINKNTAWTIDYEGGDRPHSVRRGSGPDPSPEIHPGRAF